MGDTVVRFRCQLGLSLHVITYKVLKAAHDGVCLSALASRNSN